MCLRRATTGHESKNYPKMLEAVELTVRRVNTAHLAAKEGLFPLRRCERMDGNHQGLCTLCPVFIFPNDPFGGTDPITIIEAQNVFYRLKAFGIRAVVNGHNIRETLQVFGRACKFSEGKTLEDGRLEKVAVSEEVPTLSPRKNLGLMKPEGTKPLTEHEDELNHEE
jgi:ABC-type lipopolysaccharide export system ATPase subunit